MNRPVGYGALALGVAASVAAALVPGVDVPLLSTPIPGFEAATVVVVLVKALSVLAVVSFGYGLYTLLYRLLQRWAVDRRRLYDVRNVLRLAFIAAVSVAALGVVTEQWYGLLVSLGVVGFAVTFALQQPLFSLIGWLYIVVKRPYQVGDRVAIEGSKGDVVAVDFLVTTLWEVDGDLVTSHQPSGRIVTLPNSVVLSSHVHNYSWEGFPYVWNELPVQVAYETDLGFASDLLRDVVDDYLGDDMERRVEQYRRRLEETPVELEVRDRPTVNVAQRESWVELRVRYLVRPRQAQRVRNELYRRALDRLNQHPDRVQFPVGRNR